MEKLLSKSEQWNFEKYFVRKRHPNQTTDWETICSEAARDGSTIFLSDAYKNLPKEYKRDFILRRREISDGQHRWAIQVSLR